MEVAVPRTLKAMKMREFHDRAWNSFSSHKKPREILEWKIPIRKLRSQWVGWKGDFTLSKLQWSRWQVRRKIQPLIHKTAESGGGPHGAGLWHLSMRAKTGVGWCSKPTVNVGLKTTEHPSVRMRSATGSWSDSGAWGTPLLRSNLYWWGWELRLGAARPGKAVVLTRWLMCGSGPGPGEDDPVWSIT